MFSQGLGIDLGTANTVIYACTRGIVLNEATMAVLDKEKNTLLAVGERAKDMFGRTPGNIQVVRPVRRGAIADFAVMEGMLRQFFKHLSGGRFQFFKNIRAIVAVPKALTEVERRAIEEVVLSAGARDVLLIDGCIAAAVGAGMDIERPRGAMIMDIGAGSCDISVLSLGAIVSHRSVKLGGDRMDQAIAEYIRDKYNVHTGERTAEQVKIDLGCVLPGRREQETLVRGRSLATGLPTSIHLRQAEICEALQKEAKLLIDAIRQTLEITPPEVASDVLKEGVTLTGGVAQLRGLDRLIFNETGLSVHLAPSPFLSTALGAGYAAEGRIERSFDSFTAASLV